ncbi:MAG: DUF2334 domain-containing protein [bacterium]|nr:DUF2334 domain-containing protein [bacterium]
MSLVPSWLPPARGSGVVFSIDDIHPGRSSDPYEAGGDLSDGALGHLETILASHEQVRATLFVTPDWREISPVPTRALRSRIPWINDRVMLAPIRPKGAMRLDRHAAFVDYLKGLDRTEIALHGLHHVHVGHLLPMEFQGESAARCARILREAMQIFADAGLDEPRGMTPPSWNAPPALLDAMEAIGFTYVASACDIGTPVDVAADNQGGGLRGVPAFTPIALPGRRLVHIPTNYRATSTWDRAAAILDAGGLLSVKAHIVKNALGIVALDGLDEAYATQLSELFGRISAEFGESVWWGTMSDVADTVLNLTGSGV